MPPAGQPSTGIMPVAPRTMRHVSPPHIAEVDLVRAVTCVVVVAVHALGMAAVQTELAATASLPGR